MAISSYPTPADAGVLCVILANTAISISIVREIIRSILNVMGIRIASWEELSVDPTETSGWRRTPSDSHDDEFRTRIPATRYGSIFACSQECSICLSEFGPESEVNHLCCGHVFHMSCLEKWLSYWKKTCPLCRNRMAAIQEVEGESCPMSTEFKTQKNQESKFLSLGREQTHSWHILTHHVLFGCQLGQLRPHRQAATREAATSGVPVVPAPERARVRRRRAQAVVSAADG